MSGPVDVMTDGAAQAAGSKQLTCGLVINLIDVQCATPYEIVPHLRLRRPTDAELQNIRPFMAKAGGPHNLAFYFEMIFRSDGSGGSCSDDPADWHYWFIEVDDAAPHELHCHGLERLDRHPDSPKFTWSATI
ncbi:MAG: hypothetical protein WCI73_08145 [Phycisphaerae bacterium]